MYCPSPSLQDLAQGLVQLSADERSRALSSVTFLLKSMWGPLGACFLRRLVLKPFSICIQMNFSTFMHRGYNPFLTSHATPPFSLDSTALWPQLPHLRPRHLPNPPCLSRPDSKVDSLWSPLCLLWATPIAHFSDVLSYLVCMEVPSLQEVSVHPL